MSEGSIYAPRRSSIGVMVGDVMVGGGAPVVVQSMTNTDTADPKSTIEQVRQLWETGSEIVRITVNDKKAAAAVPEIREALDKVGCPVPLVGDFHYNGHQLLTQYPETAAALAKYRINPGNVGRGNKKDSQFATIVEKAIEYDKPVRIGVNWGSLDPELVTEMMDENANAAQPREATEVMREAMVVSALTSAARAEEIGLARDRIILSVKMSRVEDLIAVYRTLAKKTDHALHLGLTEAGMGSKGIVSSSAALGILLGEGIGDTIRISLTPEPGAPRTKEVEVAQELLQSMGFRAFIPLVTACPGCGRTTSTLFQELAQDIQGYIREQMPKWRETYPGSEEMKVAVMGCIVNGPGESKHADIGISLPGNGEDPAAPVFVDGEKIGTLRGDKIAEEFQAIVDDYLVRNYGDGKPSASGAAAAE